MGRRKTLSEFIEDAENKYPNMFDYSKVVYTNNRENINIICKKHGDFITKPNWLLSGRGCVKCGSESTGNKSRNKNYLSDFIKVHGDKYDYSKVEYINNKTKVEIICKEHGSFLMNPNSHTSLGNGCPSCAYNVRNTSEFIIHSNKIHQNKYDYSKSIYLKSHSKVEIICNIHGSFYMRPNDHINMQGCPTCGKENMAHIHRKNIETYINECNVVFNNKYDYSKVIYKNNKSNIIIICKEHGDFKQIAKEHLSGRGCVKCSSSYGEQRIINYLDSLSIEYKYQHTYKDCLSANNYPLRFDFYLPSYNLCIEYDGEQHFKPIELYGGTEAFLESIKRDEIKNLYCLNNGIRLLRISFDKFRIIPTIISESISLINI